MSVHVQWIEHKGQRILYIDYSNLTIDEILGVLDQVTEEVLRQPKGSTVLTLTNMANTRTSKEMNEKAKEMSAAIREHVGLSAVAIVGLRGIQKVIAQAVRKDIYYADSIEAAKDWLVSRTKQ
jgi:hypothetical protein